ncbi:MAG: hypothetical protein EXS42_07455 [Lacunisphaera sp.]|nr:hypothetical protein [Lacunisphaera sp.]
MFRLALLLVANAVLAVLASAQDAGLAGKMSGDIYVSATGEFKIPAPVLPELGGTITDTENVVTFNDRYSTHTSIACFPLDASQKWELETRGLRDYLLYFFTDVVLADFQGRYPGASIESARFLPELMAGAVITYALLPGGSFFEGMNRVLDAPPARTVTAKRGTLLFVRNRHIFIISTELAERATQRSTYQQTPEKENALLSTRLTELAGRLVFTAPKARRS